MLMDAVVFRHLLLHGKDSWSEPHQFAVGLVSFPAHLGHDEAVSLAQPHRTTWISPPWPTMEPLSLMKCEAEASHCAVLNLLCLIWFPNCCPNSANNTRANLRHIFHRLSLSDKMLSHDMSYLYQITKHHKTVKSCRVSLMQID